MIERPHQQIQAISEFIIGHSSAIQQLRYDTLRYSRMHPQPILITGESGSGKEQVAQAIKQLDHCPNENYAAINCAALSPALIESTLFGHTKGAFTGATIEHHGFFETTNNGILFLDEITELPIEFQAKLLRVLENGEFYRVGETRPRVSRSRIIAATNHHPLQAIDQGKLRRDLYYRLGTLCLHTPPLREMGDDKQLLLEHFQQRLSQQSDQPRFRLTPAAQELWLQYTFPGNVRELRNITVRLQAHYPGQAVTRQQLEQQFASTIWSQCIPQEVQADQIEQQLQQGSFKLDQHLQEQQSQYIHVALDLAQGKISRAARILGIKRTTLHSRINANGKNLS